MGTGEKLIADLLCVGVWRSRNFMFYRDVKGCAVWEAEHGSPTLQGLNLRHQYVFFPVNPLESLLEPELRSSERFQFAFLPTVPR